LKVTIYVEGHVSFEVTDVLIQRAKEIVADGSFGPEATEDGILEHLAYNYTENSAELKYLDGFADLAEDNIQGFASDLTYKVEHKE
jgi:hypothetical protein